MTPLARAYSQAFLETAPEGYDVAGFLERARAVEHAISRDATARAFLLAPAVPFEAKARALDAIGLRAGLDERGRRMLGVVLRNRRIGQLAEILAGISEAFDARSGVAAVRVTVASPIDEKERSQIEAALARQTGRRLRMRVDVDPNVLGGFVARVGSEVFDASVAHAIERFRTEAKESSE